MMTDLDLGVHESHVVSSFSCLVKTFDAQIAACRKSIFFNEMDGGIRLYAVIQHYGSLGLFDFFCLCSRYNSALSESNVHSALPEKLQCAICLR